MPLGYEVVIFEKLAEPGGLMRINIPSFRLPASVLDEEVGYILDMGVDIRYNSPVTSMRDAARRAAGTRCSSAAARRRERISTFPDAPTPRANIHIGIEWLASAHFGHIEKIGERVLIIGVGNTAMDCCRTSRRLGGKDVKVIARRSRQYFKASPWELEDAEEEGVEIVENHAPKRFVLENGKLVGLELERLRWFEENGKQKSEVIDTRRDSVRRRDPRHRPGERVPVDRARHRHRVRQERHAGRRPARRCSRRAPGVFFGGDAAWGPENIIWAVEHGHQAAISIHNHCQGVPLTERPAYGMNLVSSKVGHARVELQQRLQPAAAHEDAARRARRSASQGSASRSSSGSPPSRRRRKSSAVSTATSQTHFTANLCIECDACIDVCPVNCLTITPDGADEFDLRTHLSAPAMNLDAGALHRRRRCRRRSASW